MHGLPLKMRFHRSKLYISAIPALVLGLLVGLLAAIMGVGGGFIMVPAMIYMLRMPTNVAVGTSPLDLAAIELLLVQRRVDATLAQEGAVGTGFHHASGVNDIDDVGVDDGGQAMGDGDGGP